MRYRNYHAGRWHRHDRIEMLRLWCLADGSVRRHRSFAAVHLTHRCARQTIRAATLCSRTSHHGRNTKAERNERNDEKYGEKAHDHHRTRTARHRQSALYLRTRSGERENRQRDVLQTGHRRPDLLLFGAWMAELWFLRFPE